MFVTSPDASIGKLQKDYRPHVSVNCCVASEDFNPGSSGNFLRISLLHVEHTFFLLTSCFYAGKADLPNLYEN